MKLYRPTNGVSRKTAAYLFAVFFQAFQVQAQAAGVNSLDDHDISVTTFAGHEFEQLCQKEDRPCGIEERRCGEIRNGVKRRPAVSHYKKLPVRNILDQAVAKHYSGYQWTTRDGVLNLEPIARVGPDLLSQKLSKVSIRGQSSKFAVEQVLSEAGLSKELAAGGSATPGAGEPKFAAVSIELSNVSVRDALNAIANADGHMIWWFCPDAPANKSGHAWATSWRTK